MSSPISAQGQSLSWRYGLGAWGTKLLRMLPAETAHELGLELLRHNALDFLPRPRLDQFLSGCRVDVPGIGSLAHPLGLAAGFDKNAVAVKGFASMGLSFLEVGTVTPRPQPGNPKPRVFRQPEQLGIINRMGFNSQGADAVARRIEALAWQHDTVPLGVNLGKNKSTSEGQAAEDYAAGVAKFKDLAKYLVINISSPNTEGLRALANAEFLKTLATRLENRLEKIWLKLDPDMSKNDFQGVVHAAADLGYQGLILTNTHRVSWPQAGGQSGHPLSSMSTTCLEWAYEVHRGSMPMIGSGGVLSGTDVFQKLIRGALAVQLYTALVYRGPWAVVQILTELMAELRLRGIECVSDAVGSFYAGAK